MIATGAGILCPACGSTDSDVVDSRPGQNYIRRRRRCKTCVPVVRFTTVELTVEGLGVGSQMIPRALQFEADLSSLRPHERSIIIGMLAALLSKRNNEAAIAAADE